MPYLALHLPLHLLKYPTSSSAGQLYDSASFNIMPTLDAGVDRRECSRYRSGISSLQIHKIEYAPTVNQEPNRNRAPSIDGRMILSHKTILTPLNVLGM